MAGKISILGAGFIGSNLIEACIRQGYSVSVLDRNPCPPELASHVEWVNGEFDSEADVLRTIRNAQCVFHLISNTVPGDVVSESEELFNNVSQTLRLSRLCTKANINRLLFISSASVYGLQDVFPISEMALPNPISSHGIQKLTIEKYLQLHKYENGLDCKIIRLSNPFGKGQSLYGRQGFISILTGNLIRKNITEIRGDGKAIRDFIYIDDVVDACLLLAESDTSEVLFNIGSGEGYSLNSVVQEVESILGVGVPLIHTKTRKADIPSSVLDISKAREILNYNPSTTFHDGLKKFFSMHHLIQ